MQPRPGSALGRVEGPPYAAAMDSHASQGRLGPELMNDAVRWVDLWAETGPLLERIRNQELRELDTSASIALLCGKADYHTAPFAPEPTSGLVEQQRLFARLLSGT